MGCAVTCLGLRELLDNDKCNPISGVDDFNQCQLFLVFGIQAFRGLWNREKDIYFRETREQIPFIREAREQKAKFENRGHNVLEGVGGIRGTSQFMPGVGINRYPKEGLNIHRKTISWSTWSP